MRYLGLILLVFLIGCQDEGQSLPTGAIQIKPPHIYQTWFQEVADCSGFRSDFDAIQWYMVPNVSFFYSTTQEHPTMPQRLAGVTYFDGHPVIVIAELYIDNGYLVRHEMLHVLANTGSHPPEIFGPKAPCFANISHVGL